MESAVDRLYGRQCLATSDGVQAPEPAGIDAPRNASCCRGDERCPYGTSTVDIERVKSTIRRPTPWIAIIVNVNTTPKASSQARSATGTHLLPVRNGAPWRPANRCCCIG